MACALLIAVTWLSAAAAQAVPGVGELYMGAGLRSFGGAPWLAKASTQIDYGFCAEAGIDDMALIRNWGIGLRGDWRTVTGKYNAELRYTLFRLAPIRILGGASLGLGGDNLLDGRLGAFVAIRTVLGLPYVSAQLGVFRSPGDGGVSSAGFVFGGVAF